MIISSTPLRISFAGGGSDMPSFYKEEGGAVISTAINKYVYVTVNNRFEKGFRLGYSKTEIVDTVDQIQHKVHRAVLRKLAIGGGLEITSIADIPSHGTGLGSSSSFTVGLLNALHAYKKEFRSAEDLAQEACEVEMIHCQDPVGKQDQYIAAYGGFKFIQFNSDESVFVDPVICQSETLEQLQNNLLVFHTGFSRNSGDILKAQSEIVLKDAGKKGLLRKMVQLAFTMKEELQKNNLDSFGEILHENWLLKREIVGGISNPQIDDWHARAQKSGALGGKLLGAGGGGFLMFYAPQERHPQIKQALPELRPIDIQFEKQGSKIIFIH